MAPSHWFGWILAALIALTVLGMMFFSAADRGFWEPWEASVLLTDDAPADEADEADTDEDTDEADTDEATAEVIPATLGLRSFLFDLTDEPPPSQSHRSSLERSTRLPSLGFALLLLLFCGFFIQRTLGPPAAFTTVALLTTAPIFFAGATVLSSTFLPVALTTLAVLSFVLAHLQRERRIESLVFSLIGGLATALCTLELGLIGFYAVIAPLVALAMAMALYSEDRTLSLPVLGVTLIVAMGLFFRNIDDPRPPIDWVVLPVLLLVGGLLASWRHPVAQSLIRAPGLAIVLGGLIPLLMIADLMAVLTVHSPAAEIPLDQNFSWWWRQVGFSLFPHVIFIAPALGYLTYKLSFHVDSSATEKLLAALLLVWPAATFVVVVPAADLGHTAFPAVLPFLFAVAWMASDSSFWATLRRHPATYLTIGLTALFALQILSKDLSNYPTRLVEFLLFGDQGLELPEDYTLHDRLGTLKNLYLLGLIAFFGGAISWAAFTLQDLGKLLRWVGSLKERLRGKTLANPERPAPKTAETDAEPPGPRRAREREEWRDQPGLFNALARLLERTPGLLAMLFLFGTAFASLHLLALTQDLNDRLSAGSVIQAYLELAEDSEPLYRYQVPEREVHFYLQGLEQFDERRDFQARLGDDERFFAVIPEDRLAAIHSTLRRSHQGFQLPVLATGGGLLLVSNQIRDHEEDLNPITPFLLDEPPEDMIPLSVTFNRQVELIGYQLDRGGPDDRARYSWGDEMELTLYYRVIRRIPGNQRVFLHIDYPGNRIHGDHDPVGGVYPTNHWQPGDIVKNTHTVEIDRFNAPGTYIVWTGLYRGNDRMEVGEDDEQDGQNRVEITRIEVSPL